MPNTSDVAARFGLSGIDLSGAAGRPQLLSGASPNSLSFLAAILPAIAGRPVVFVVPGGDQAELLLHDTAYYGQRLGGAAAYFPALEPEPYLGIPPHLQVVVERVKTFFLAEAGSLSAVVLPAEALLLAVPPADALRQLAIRPTVGSTVDRDQLVRDLIRAGYRRQDMVGSIGEVAARGGIVDVFSPASSEPYRLELDGDTVDSIRLFDPVTQRSLSELDRAEILPVRLFAVPDDADERLRDWGVGLTPEVMDDLRSKRDALQSRGSFGGIEFYAPALLEQLVDPLALFAGFAVVIIEPDAVRAEYEKGLGALQQVHREMVERGVAVPTPEDLAIQPAAFEQLLASADAHLQALSAGGAESPLRTQPARRYDGHIKELVRDLAKDREDGIDAVVVVPSAGEAERVEAMLSEYSIPYLEGERAREVWTEPRSDGGPGRVTVDIGRLQSGFRSPQLRLATYAAPEVFGGGLPPPRRRRRSGAAFASDFRDLKVGDFVVHVDHGIARFLGLKTMTVGGVSQELMVLAYSGDDKVLVPLDRLDLVQKYSGVEGAEPHIDKLGGTSWARVKSKVKADLRSMAGELLQLYAARKIIEGHAFAPDGLFQREFEDAFPYTETPDQLSAIQDIKRDMESTRCMDRLLCGDVGFGKTEVAMRAAFKAIADGKQVAVLAPTTVLAFQHDRTFTQRFAQFPVTVAMVSRFRNKKEIDATLADVAAGKVDVLIGTHRLLSKDVVFRDLGLLIVDEEQRFGVAHKEKLKQLKQGVDVLTLSATPIPRTLQMALGGLRDMSTIETPPRDRLAIETTVLSFSGEVIKEAIKREMERGGQCFMVHNRVESIQAMADALHKIAPFARILVGHGQMREKELEETMLRFAERHADVLLATTIIENGLDLPNVNTILINRAHRLGLSQLYQLRGRVGRSDRPAYAYLLTPPRAELSPIARRRLHAIQEFCELGSGFRIAALDLELRGAGDILGRRQHGHIGAVGFDLYMELLEQAIREFKGEAVSEVNTQLNLALDTRIPTDYIDDANQRMMVYKRLAGARTVGEIDDFATEVGDRFGPIPAPVVNLLEAGRLRLDARAAGVVAVDRKGGRATLRFTESPAIEPAALMRFAKAEPDRKLHPDGRLEFEVSNGAEAVEEIRIALAELG